MSTKKPTIDYSEHPLTKNFLNNIMSQGGEAAGVYTLKNDESKVVRVMHMGDAAVAEDSKAGIYGLLMDIGKSEHWPSRALKTESIDVVHGDFSDYAKAAHLQVQQRGHGTHDLADFKSASKEQLNQLIQDVSTLDRLGISFDVKPRNMLFDKKIGFQLLDLMPKTLYASAEEAMQKNSTRDASFANRVLGITEGLLGHTFSREDLRDAIRSSAPSKPVVTPAQPKAAEQASYSLLDKIARVETPTEAVKGYHLSKADTIRKFDFTKTGSNTIGTSFGTVTANNDSKYGVMFATDETKNVLLGYASHPSAPLGNNIYDVSLNLNKIAVVDVLDAVKERATGRNLTVDEILQGRQSLIDAGYDGMRIVGAPNGKLLENTLVVLNDPNKIDILSIQNTQSGQSLYTKPVNSIQAQPAIPTVQPITTPVNPVVPPASPKPPKPPKVTRTPPVNPVIAPIPAVVVPSTVQPRQPPPPRQPPIPPSQPPSGRGLSTGLFSRPHISLDIETTDRDATKGRIWNIGYTSSDGRSGDIFISPNQRRKVGKKTLAKTVTEMSEGRFNQKQLLAGKYAPYFQSLTDGTARTNKYASTFIRDLTASMQPGSFLLIQNAFFENKFFANHANRMGMYEHIQGNMEFRSKFTEGASGFLYTPPQVTSHRAYGTQAYESFLLSHNSKDFETTLKHYQGMMNEYTEIAKQAQKPFVVDLMDITKATYALAASKGLIDKTNIHMGTGIEFLAHHLLEGEKELHLGMADSNQQYRIAHKLADLYDKLSTNTLDEAGHSLLKQIGKAQEGEHGRQFIKALKSGLEESISPSGYKKNQAKTIHKIEGLSDSRGNSLHANVYRSNYPLWQRHLITTNDADVTIADVVENARKRLRLNEENISGVLGELKKRRTTEDKISYLYDLEEKYKAGDKLPEGDIAQPKGLFEKIKKLSVNKKIGAAIGLAGVAYLMASDSTASSGNIKKIKRKREMRERTQDLDSNIRLYSRLDNYHGSGFATWNDRTKHHEY